MLLLQNAIQMWIIIISFYNKKLWVYSSSLFYNIGAVIAFILMQVMCLTEMATLSELASHLIVIVIKETMITL